MLCSFCLHEVLESNKSWGYHQIYDSLQKSKDNGVVCIRLDEDVSDGYKELPDSSKITHRWTLRKTPRTRELDESISLIFRAIIDEPSSENTIPMRQFFFMPDKGNNL
jgi:hypothetical protein